ncbi:MAG TPA: dihydrodipicolinate synthase family protein [Acidimicrobiales bacterium]|jgi:4-hydroxy-tetrahydrodipicolinate synthase|nr:dihydrodipicolinate synthase family protein [Acidimicrobiales bacterium]
MLPYKRNEARAWAREAMQGVANVVIPSYTADMRDINEAGIRHDVRREIELGFAGFLLVAETALTDDEYLRFVEISNDEAKGKQLLIHHATFNTLEDNIKLANEAAARGATLSLLSYPPSWYPKNEQDIYDYTKAFCDNVDMAVMLFPVPLWGFERIHPASLSADLMQRLVDDCETVVAIKAEGGHPSIGGFTEAWYRFNEQVVVTMPLEQQGIPFATIVPMQFIGTSNTEYFGGAIPQMLSLAREGKNDEAMRLYWQTDPARQANGKIGAIGGANTVHRMAWKYQAWLTGFNGGPVRQPTARIVGSQMNMLRAGLVASGIDCTSDSDDLFFVGRNPA